MDQDKKSPGASPLLETKKVQKEQKAVGKISDDFLENLYRYFEKYPVAFKEEMEAKNILLVE